MRADMGVPTAYPKDESATSANRKTERIRPQPVKIWTPDLHISAESDAESDIGFRDVLQTWSMERLGHQIPPLPIILDPEAKKGSPLPPLPKEASRPHPSEHALTVSAMQPHLSGLGTPEPRRASSLPSPFCAWPTPRSSVAGTEVGQAMVVLGDNPSLTRRSHSADHWDENVAEWLPPTWIRDVLGSDDQPWIAKMCDGVEASDTKSFPK
jgi:hypothetical protein